jgi:uncharacterized protein YlzI (FlbEa/FlbD family)
VHILYKVYIVRKLIKRKEKENMFVKLNVFSSGNYIEECSVNPDHIVYMRKFQDDTFLKMSSGTDLRVTETPDEIEMKIAITSAKTCHCS